MTAPLARIAYLAHTLNPGGTERLAVDMALRLASSYDVRVICLDEPGLWAAQLREQGIPVYCLWRQAGFDPGVVLRLARLLREGNVDLVHAHQCTPWFYGGLARLLYRKPCLLLEEHGRFYPEIRKPLRIIVNRLLIRRLTQSIVAVSADIRERLVTYEGLAHEAIRVIYNGVRPLPAAVPGERELRRAELGFRAEDFVIGTVGRLDPIKNLPLLLRAFKVLGERHPQLRLLVVGDGPERGRIGALVRELRLESTVTLSGFRSDARGLLPALDLFTMTSFSEGTSMALLEAMSAGLPIAVSLVGGNPEIIRDDQTGLLFASDDTHALVDVLERLYMDRELRERLGKAARIEFSNRFSFDAMIDQYRKLYGELLAGRT